MIKAFHLFSLYFLVSCTTSSLIEEKFITEIKSSTASTYLSPKKIRHTHRMVTGSQLVAIDFNFLTGISAIKAEQKILPGLLFKALPFASKNYSRDQVIKILEKLGASFSCGTGIEYSKCHLLVVKDHLEQVLPVVFDLMENPKFEDEHVSLIKSQARSDINGQFQSPNFLANEAVNGIFYGDHPFWTPYERRLKQIDGINAATLRSYYSNQVRGKLKEIVSVAAYPQAAISALLNKYLDRWPSPQEQQVFAAPSPTAKGQRLSIVDQDNATAYFIIKMPMPGIAHEDNTAANFMMKILDEELSLEVRTKQSLSYAIYAYQIDYSIGIGVIGGSTSKPKETLTAVLKVIQRLKETELSPEQVARHKNVYVTSLFLEMEGHSSLAHAIGKGRIYRNDSNYSLASVLEIENLTGSDVQTMALKYLKNMKGGIVFAKDRVDEKWFSAFP